MRERYPEFPIEIIEKGGKIKKQIEIDKKTGNTLETKYRYNANSRIEILEQSLLDKNRNLLAYNNVEALRNLSKTQEILKLMGVEIKDLTTLNVLTKELFKNFKNE